MIEKAWAKFFWKGWDVNNVPDKKACFVAGFNAAVEMMNDKPGKKTVPEIIREWHEKYEGKDE